MKKPFTTQRTALSFVEWLVNCATECSLTTIGLRKGLAAECDQRATNFLFEGQASSGSIKFPTKALKCGHGDSTECPNCRRRLDAWPACASRNGFSDGGGPTVGWCSWARSSQNRYRSFCQRQCRPWYRIYWSAGWLSWCFRHL